jgi:hypothetical protein
MLVSDIHPKDPGFGVLKVAIMSSMFWDTVQCSLVKIN